MFDVGRVCVKLAGRDAGKRCVVVDRLEGPYVLVDGETRRRKVNTFHLLPLDQTVKVSKGADHAAVSSAVSVLGLTVRNTKPKTAAPRKKASRRAKKPAAQETPKKEAKKAVKKAAKKVAASEQEKSE